MVVFLFFVVIFQMFLSGSIIEKSNGSLKKLGTVYEILLYSKGLGTLDFGDDIILSLKGFWINFERKLMRLIYGRVSIEYRSVLDTDTIDCFGQ